MRITPDNIDTLKPNEVFVFGSNLAGHHYGGAAKKAYADFGAVWNEGAGHLGSSYAIPTMDADLKPLSLVEIGAFIFEFLTYVKANQHLIFLVTPIGCGIAGFSPVDIALLFKAAKNVGNIALPASFCKELA